MINEFNVYPKNIHEPNPFIKFNIVKAFSLKSKIPFPHYPLKTKPRFELIFSMKDM